ncbi:3-dehydroquinate dehydratase [Oleiphilus sp. HI0079]|uniref:type II 3-dehydroquinate dehydratase n=1 Tax=Oleiphilus sp. HI0079 TaxID=1822254 RepID=UPI0007C2514D|nr:type II 3-dehydroquinate dehydratase [Oleiphilus sp. HI0079]KZZ12558.1 3-dehydroquinate dehydratase [Oleiphilus sp. HI0079]
MPSILVLNGPNLNLLGKREPHIYGSETLQDIVTRLETHTEGTTLSIKHFQSNAEHELIEHAHGARESDVCAIIINPGAFTHTSIALRDALLATDLPFYEVHISNVHAREEFRHKSYFSDKAVAVICGLGTHGYDAAVLSALRTAQS